MVATLDPPSPGTLTTVMGRPQLIERITAFNPTATPEFLCEFDDDALALYLEHLHAKLAEPESKKAWTRPGDTAAIVWREAHDAA